MIRALIFDLDGTLYRASPVRRRMSWRLLGHLARRPADGLQTVRFLSAYRQAQEALRTGGQPVGPGDQLALACRVRGATADWGAQIVARWMDEAPLDLLREHMRPGFAECLTIAKSLGIRAALFSDYPPEAKLHAMGIREWFDVVRWAQQPDIAAFKPNPRGLQVILEALGLRPDEAVYVGDRPEVDCDAAARAGMRAVIIGQRRRRGHRAGDWLHVHTFADLGDELAHWAQAAQGARPAPTPR